MTCIWRLLSSPTSGRHRQVRLYIYIYIYIYVCMCVYVCVYIYVCICMCVYIYIYIYIYICVCVCVYMRVRVCICIYIYIYICVCVCLSICVCVCVHILPVDLQTPGYTRVLGSLGLADSRTGDRISGPDTSCPPHQLSWDLHNKEGRKEMFYLTTHSTHFMYIW